MYTGLYHTKADNLACTGADVLAAFMNEIYFLETVPRERENYAEKGEIPTCIC